MGLHKDVEEANLHESKGVSSATVDKVFVTDGLGSGAFRLYKPTNVVYVNSAGDFPSPSGGIITLASNTHYVIGAPFTIADRFALTANVSISSTETNGPLLDYTGTGAMFTGSGVNFTIQHAHLTCATGTLLNMTGGFTRIDDTTVDATAKDGSMTDIVGLVVQRCSFLNSTQGFEFLGTGVVGILSLSKMRYITVSATSEFVDLGTSVFSTLEIENIVLTAPAGAVALKGLAASANMLAGKIGLIASCEFDPLMTVLSGLAANDIRYEFVTNSGIDDSTKAADTFITATQLVTIASIGVFVVINGGSWSSDIANRFTTTTAGRLTYVSEVDATFLISGTATLDKTTGGSDVLEMRIALNGTTLAKSGTFTQSADPTTVMSQALITLTKDDFLELFVANNTSTGNIDVNVANLTARVSG